MAKPTGQLIRIIESDLDLGLRAARQARNSGDTRTAYHGTILENETAMRGVEIRNLQVKRIDLMAAEIQLQKSKTKGGVRRISLSADALESVKELLKRAQAPGASLPDHYLIPALVTKVVQRKNRANARVPTNLRRADAPHGVS